MISNVKQFIYENALLAEGDVCLAAVSGGCDSMALLSVLRSLMAELDVAVCAAHFNHQIRGRESDADAAFVQEYCAQNGIEFYAGAADIPAIAAAEKLSVELAARRERYAFLERAAKRAGANKIALAHHMGDQTETILLNLMRGSGLRGMCGMRARRGVYIRPFLHVGKREILDYCAESHIPFREDETNLQSCCTRNRVRLEVAPRMTEIQPRLDAVIARSVQNFRADLDYLDAEAKRRFYAVSEEDAYGIRLTDEFFALHDALKTRVLALALAKLGADSDVERRHLESVIAMQDSRTGSRVNIVKGIYAARANGYLRLTRGGQKCMDIVPLTYDMMFSDKRITARLLSAAPADLSEHGADTAYFSADGIPEGWVARTRREGDIIMPLGCSYYRKLKDYLIDRKIERLLRDQLILIADGAEIIWAAGVGQSENYKVTANSPSVMKIAVE